MAWNFAQQASDMAVAAFWESTLL